MPTLETRAFELRRQGDRRLTGIAMRYGSVAQLPFGGERFEPGAFGDIANADIILNHQHDRGIPLARTGGGGLVMDDNERRLILLADLPNTTAANDALELVDKRILRGFSIEFFAQEERFENRIRVVEKADIVGVGLVDRPAYSDSIPALRALGLSHADQLRDPASLQQIRELLNLGSESHWAAPPPKRKRRIRWR